MLRRLLTEFRWNIGWVMPRTCPFLLLFVLKLENHLSYELEIVYRAWAPKISKYILFFFRLDPHTPHPTPKKKMTKKKKKKQQFLFFQIRILCQNSLTRKIKIRVVGFVLWELFTYFEMLKVYSIVGNIKRWFGEVLHATRPKRSNYLIIHLTDTLRIIFVKTNFTPKIMIN